MTYLDEDLTHEAEAVSGSCMMIRRQVIEQIGYQDENFFAYQEDTDYCRRTRLASWKVFYNPSAQIIHYGGEAAQMSSLSVPSSNGIVPITFIISPYAPSRDSLSGAKGLSPLKSEVLRFAQNDTA